MPKRPFVNRLNDLLPKEWLKFQKSWFIHNPPPRRKDVLRHPAKYPETLAQEFIEFFTKRGQVVFDPMVGTGSTLVAAIRSGRHGYGIELNPAYAAIATQVLEDERSALGAQATGVVAKIIHADATHLADIFKEQDIPEIDYMITSPPYWNMLHAHGAQSQRQRRSTTELDVIYSEDPNDLGNVRDYDEFIQKLSSVYEALKPNLKHKAYLTIIVKNIKKGGVIYPLAWDLAKQLGHTYTLKDEKIWVQDNQRLSPYGLGNAWVSNTFHHYCLQFRND